MAIPNNSPAGTTYTFNITASQVITDLDVYVDMSHTFLGDVTLQLNHGAVNSRLIDRPGIPGAGCSGDNVDNVFDDEGTINGENSCANSTPAYPAGASIIPLTPLSVFDGANVNGEWSLFMRDLAAANTGTVHTICLELPENSNPTAVSLADVTVTTTNTMPVALFAAVGMMLVVVLGFVIRRK